MSTADWEPVDVEGRLEDIEFMIAHGETGDGAAGRLGVSVEGMRKWLRRVDRLDLFRALRDNEVKKFGATLSEIRRHEAARRRRGPKRRAA